MIFWTKLCNSSFEIILYYKEIRPTEHRPGKHLSEKERKGGHFPERRERNRMKRKIKEEWVIEKVLEKCNTSGTVIVYGGYENWLHYGMNKNSDNRPLAQNTVLSPCPSLSVLSCPPLTPHPNFRSLSPSLCLLFPSYSLSLTCSIPPKSVPTHLKRVIAQFCSEIHFQVEKNLLTST